MKSKKKSKHTLVQMKIRTQQLKICGIFPFKKAILTGKFIALDVYLQKQEKPQIHNLTLHLKQTEKEQLQQKKTQSEEKEGHKKRSEHKLMKQSLKGTKDQ